MNEIKLVSTTLLLPYRREKVELAEHVPWRADLLPKNDIGSGQF